MPFNTPTLDIVGIESKTSIDFNSIRLSSYKGWFGKDSYPKLLVISILNKKKSRQVKSKHWDINGEVREIKEVKIITDSSQIVDHDESLHARVLETKKSDLEKSRALKEEVKRANKASRKPIKLDLPGAQKTGQLRLYLSLKKSEFSSLEDAPSEIIGYIAKKTIGAKFSMEKDYSDIGGPSGKFDESMFEWEIENGPFDTPKVKRRRGTLLIHYPDGNVSRIPDWEDGREMYFTGHAMEECLKEIFDLQKTESHTPGIDLRLSDGEMIQIDSLIRRNSLEMNEETEAIIGKNKLEILALIFDKLGLKVENRHYSTGSTVQLNAITEIIDTLSISRPRKITKESTIKAIIESLGEKFDIETDMSNPGSTIQALALIKVLRGLNNRDDAKS